MSIQKKIGIALMGMVTAAMLLQNTGYNVKASSAEVDRNIYNGKLENGRVFAPLRGIGDKLGAQVTWNNSTKKATVTKDGVKLEVQVGSKDMIVGDRTIAMDVTPQIENGSTYLPLKYIGEAFGYTVNWYKESRIAYLEDMAPFIGVYAQPIIDSEGMALLDLAISKTEKLSEIPQKRAYLKPYFTDQMINTLISKGGLTQRIPFQNEPSYRYSYPSDTSMKVYKEVFNVESSGYATQESLLVKKGDHWLVQSIKHDFYEMRP